jgi:gluconolactonase
MTVPTPSRHALLGAAAAFAAVAPDGPFNAPNDGVVHPVDGALWLTDPGYGGLMDYEGNRVPESANPPRPFIKEAGYRLDTSGELTKVTDAPFKPNGLCFSPDHSKLYVADTGKSHYPEAKNIIGQLDVNGARLSNGRVFADMTFESKAGFADGIRADQAGNIWSSAGWVGDGYDGVHIFAPNGDRIGLIKLPEIGLSVCFGGARRNRLFMTASQSLYSVMVETRGAHFC